MGVTHAQTATYPTVEACECIRDAYEVIALRR